MNNNYVYRYEQFVLKKTLDGYFVVVNINSKYENHSHVKSFKTGKALCKLAAKRKLPKKKDSYFIESLIRLTNNKKYINELNNLKKNLNTNIPNTKKENKKELTREINDGINEYFKNEH